MAVQDLREAGAELVKIAQREKRAFNGPLYREWLRRAETRLEFWQARHAQALSGGIVEIRVPASYVNNLKEDLADLQQEHTRVASRREELDRKIKTCAQANRPSDEAPTPMPTPAQTPSASVDWTGTYKDGSAMITISASGDSLAGSWENKFGGSGSDTADFTCKVTGKTAHCDYTGSYYDAQKTISSRVGTVDLAIDGTTITVTVHEVSDTLAWTNGDQGYTPAIHPGAKLSGTWIRQ